MSKLNLAIGAKVFYENNAYTIVKAVDYNTVTIQSTDDNNTLLNVLTKDLSSTKEPQEYNLEQYNDKEWEQARKKYEVIKDLVFRQRSRLEVEECAKGNNVGTTTIYTWLRIYEETESMHALVAKKRGKKGGRLDKVVEKIIDDILEEYYLTKQKTKFTKIYRLIKQACKKLNITAPHANTVRNRINAIDPKLSMKRREGYKKSHQAFNNFEGKFPEGNFPLDVVQIDHTPLDIMLVDSIHREPEGRPTLTLAIDVYSRMITGFYLSLQAPGYFNVSQCLLQSLMPKDAYLKKENVEGEWNIFGIPRIIHVDNGQDLVSNDMIKVCDDLNITLLKRPVANPQFGAHVERVFGTINQEIHNLPGATFSNVNEKGDYDSAKMATFTLEELRRWLTHYIVNIYHKRIHHGLDMTPDEKYYQGIFGDDENPGTGILPSIVENKEHIRILLLQTFLRTVQKDGITLDGITYYSDVLRAWINRKDKDNNKIKFKIKRDPMNIQKIYFYDPELKEYFEIFYKKISAPKMTLWDMQASKRYLKEHNISNYTEDDIFKAYDVLAKLEKEAKEKTSKKKLRKNKSPKMSEQQEKTSTKKETQEDHHLDVLFNNIETLTVHEKQEMKDI